MDPVAGDGPWPERYGRPVHDEYTMQGEIASLENALDAANGRLARIESWVTDRTLFPEEMVGLILDMLDN